MKRLLTVTVVLISLLVVAGMAAWLQRDTLARSMANRLLDGTGLQVTELAGFRPSFSGTTAGELAVELTDSGRIQRFHDIEVDYHVTGLRDGQLRDIRVGRVELDMAAGTATSDPFEEALRLTDVSEMLRQAPLRSVYIDDLRLSGRTMALTLRWQDGRLAGQLGDGATRVQLDIDWQVDEAGGSQPAPAPFLARLRARTSSQPALEWEFEVVPHNGMLDVQASGRIDSATARPVIDAVAELLSLPASTIPPLSVSAGIAVHATVPDAVQIPRTLQLTASVEAGGDIAVPASLLTNAGAGAVEGRWNEPVALALERRSSDPEWAVTLNGEHLALSLPNVNTGTVRVNDASLTLNGYRLHCRAMASCEFSTGSVIRASGATLAVSVTDALEPVALREPSVTLPALEGSLAGSTLSLRASAGTHFSLPEAGLAAWTARDTEATLQAAANLSLPLGNIEGLHLRTGDLSVNLPLLRNGEHMAGLQLRVQRLTASPLGDFSLDTSFQLSHAYTNLFPVNLWDATLDAAVVAGDERIDLEAVVTLNDRTFATFNGRHDLAASFGEGRLQVPDITFESSGSRLSDFIAPLPVPVDLVAGTFGGEAELAWRMSEERTMPVLTGSVDFELTDIAGVYDSIGFINLDTRVDARLGEDLHLRSEAEAPFRISRLNVGFPIEDIEATYRFDSVGPSIQLSGAGMTLFGGRITTDRLTYDASAESNTNTLRLERIDIERLLSLSAYEGITATGLVSGEIPLTIRGTQLTVSGGTITALPPGGTISYRDGPTDTGNNNMDLVYSALRNYRYSQLEADVDYMADGELLLAVRMEGVAPAIDNQRINLNVNISDNIPSLLESLQAGRDIAESIRLQQEGREQTD